MAGRSSGRPPFPFSTPTHPTRSPPGFSNRSTGSTRKPSLTCSQAGGRSTAAAFIVWRTSIASERLCPRRSLEREHGHFGWTVDADGDVDRSHAAAHENGRPRTLGQPGDDRKLARGDRAEAREHD